MKKIGIVGGLAWRTTVEYYIELCRRSERQFDAPGGQSKCLELCIESLDLETAVGYIGVDDDEVSWSRFDAYHHAALQRLQASGAECAVIASNTPHHRFEVIVKDIRIPVIDIVVAAAEECARARAKRVLILGTALTMRSPRLRQVFADHGMEAVGPESEEIRALTIRLIEELQCKEIADAAQRLGEIARTVFATRSTAKRVVCLACTELALAFPERRSQAAFSVDGITYINSAMAHVGAAFDFASR